MVVVVEVDTGAAVVVAAVAVTGTEPEVVCVYWAGNPARIKLDRVRSVQSNCAGMIGCAVFTPMKEENIEIEGCIQTVLPGTMFRVELDNKHLVLATISGKMRKRWVRLTVGDRVKMEMSPYDMDKARIIWRLKDEPTAENQA